MSRRLFTPWDVLWVLAWPTAHWAPWPELPGLGILVLLVYGTLAVSRATWTLLAAWCVPGPALRFRYPDYMPTVQPNPSPERRT